MPDTAPATIEQHEYSNGLVLVAEVMPGVQSAAFTLLIPAGAAYEVSDGLNVGGRGHNGGRMDHARRWIAG